MNVSMSNVPSYEKDDTMRKQYALQALELCLNFFVERGIGVKAIAPKGFVEAHRPEIEVFEKAGLLYISPGRGLDDNFLIQHADAYGSFIVSNDRFADHVRERGYDPNWLEYHRVPFMFDPNFSPEPDALVRMQEAHQGLTPLEFGPGRARLTPDTKPLQVVSKQRPSNETTSFRVPQNAVGRIIGRSGVTIKALELEYSVRIAIADGPADNESTVTISKGTSEHNRNAAADAILKIVDRSPPHQVNRRSFDDDDTANALRSKHFNDDRLTILSETSAQRRKRGISLPPPPTPHFPLPSSDHHDPSHFTVILASGSSRQENKPHDSSPADHHHTTAASLSPWHHSSSSSLNRSQATSYDYSLYHDHHLPSAPSSILVADDSMDISS